MVNLDIDFLTTRINESIVENQFLNCGKDTELFVRVFSERDYKLIKKLSAKYPNIPLNYVDNGVIH